MDGKKVEYSEEFRKKTGRALIAVQYQIKSLSAYRQGKLADGHQTWLASRGADLDTLNVKLRPDQETDLFFWLFDGVDFMQPTMIEDVGYNFYAINDALASTEKSSLPVDVHLFRIFGRRSYCTALEGVWEACGILSGLLASSIYLNEDKGNSERPVASEPEKLRAWIGEHINELYDTLADLTLDASEWDRLMKRADRELAILRGLQEPPQPPPVAISLRRKLVGYPEILDFLGLDDSRKKWLMSCNKRWDGPIQSPGRGHKPFADEQELKNWYSDLESKAEEKSRADRDREQTVNEMHEYGKTGTVVPEIGGSVKKRRKRQNPS